GDTRKTEAIRNGRYLGYWFAWPVTKLPDEDAASRSGILRHLHVSPKLLPRKAALEKLKRVLLRDREADTCTYLTAAAGMGGIGKTVLASLAMRDPEVQARFPGGIIAITIGRDPSDLWLLKEAKAIHEALVRSTPDWKELTDIYDKVLQLLKNKAVLLVVD